MNAWDSYDEPSREAMVHLQAALAGMVDHTDEQIGRFIDMLEELGELDNTVVVLLSDNGASQEGGEVGSLNSMKVFAGGFDPPGGGSPRRPYRLTAAEIRASRQPTSGGDPQKDLEIELGTG